MRYNAHQYSICSSTFLHFLCSQFRTMNGAQMIYFISQLTYLRINAPFSFSFCTPWKPCISLVKLQHSSVSMWVPKGLCGARASNDLCCTYDMNKRKFLCLCPQYFRLTSYGSTVQPILINTERLFSLALLRELKIPFLYVDKNVRRGKGFLSVITKSFIQSFLEQYLTYCEIPN